jgi:hypothetical protein
VEEEPQREPSQDAMVGRLWVRTVVCCWGWLVGWPLLFLLAILGYIVLIRSAR